MTKKGKIKSMDGGGSFFFEIMKKGFLQKHLLLLLNEPENRHE